MLAPKPVPPDGLVTAGCVPASGGERVHETREMKLRSYLAILVFAGTIPLIVLTGVLTVSLVHQQRAAVDRGLSDTTGALAAVIENELEASIKSLETLATSRSLDREDLPTFYEQARRVRDLHRWSTIGLIDGAGNHRLNAARPLGASL